MGWLRLPSCLRCGQKVRGRGRGGGEEGGAGTVCPQLPAPTGAPSRHRRTQSRSPAGLPRGCAGRGRFGDRAWGKPSEQHPRRREEQVRRAHSRRDPGAALGDPEHPREAAGAQEAPGQRCAPPILPGFGRPGSSAGKPLPRPPWEVTVLASLCWVQLLKARPGRGEKGAQHALGGGQPQLRF